MATTMPRSARQFDSPDALALDWGCLYDEHAPRLHRIAARRVGADHANDVVQDIFIRAYRNRAAIDCSRPVGAWLSTIALRASTDALRRRSARAEVLVEEDDESAVVGGEVDDEFENTVRREGIRAAFESLSERQQRVFRHLAIDGWTQEEVAADEGISTEAVKSLFARARRTFKETYQTFAERMGVFGGAAAGTAVWRLRTRLQRLYGLVGEHAGAITATAATVTVVAIATVPTSRATPTRAAEPDQAAIPSPSAARPAQVLRTERVAAVERTAAQPAAIRPAVPTAQGPQANAAATRAAAATNVHTAADVGRHGQGASLAVTAGTDGSEGDRQGFAGVNIRRCDADAISRSACVGMEALEATVPGD